MGNGYGLPSGTEKRLVERFKLNPDQISLTYRYELEDAEYLESPISGEVQWAYRPDLEFSLRECDPENARRFLNE